MVDLQLGTELGFEPGEGQSMNQKNFMWHGLLKKKNHGRQKIALYCLNI